MPAASNSLRQTVSMIIANIAPLRLIAPEGFGNGADGRASLTHRGANQLLLVATAVALAEVGFANALWAISRMMMANPVTDFGIHMLGARTGLSDGWSHLYTHPVAEHPFANPPIAAWLLVPFAHDSPRDGALTFAALATICLIAAGLLPELRLTPSVVIRVLSALAFVPAAGGIVVGQFAPFVLLAIAGAGLLMARRQDLAAGVLLGVVSVKPQLGLLLPVVLFAGGRSRAAAAMIGTVGVMALASAVSLGPTGVAEYIRLLQEMATFRAEQQWSLAAITGDGLPWVLSVVAAVGLVAAVARRIGPSDPGALCALAVVGTLLCNHYLTPSDFTLLLLPIWHFGRLPTVHGRVVAGGLWLVGNVALAIPLVWPVAGTVCLLLLAWNRTTVQVVDAASVLASTIAPAAA